MSGVSTPIETIDGVLQGPLRYPRQMLTIQQYDGHASIHDDATAQSLGFKRGTIEGSTHFSQFAPLGHAVWGDRWLTNGCISAHYRSPAFEGEAVQAFLREPQGGERFAEIWMLRDDETVILRGTASVGSAHLETALDKRLAELPGIAEAVILADVRVGATVERRPVRMDADQVMGALYPFSLNQKLEQITEPSSYYTAPSPIFQHAILPMEMISVLLTYSSDNTDFKVRGPAVGLFADQEISLLDGPVFVGERYDVERKVVFLSGSRRTESLWVRSTLYRAGTDHQVATMLLNQAYMKESYAPYEQEYADLYK